MNTSGSQVWLPLSCYVTYFESTHVNTLAHQLMFKGNTVNITGAMTLSNHSDNQLMSLFMLEGLFNEDQSIGESVNQANRQLNNPKQPLNMMILGDSSLGF